MDYSIKELAEAIGVSKTAIRKRIQSLGLEDDLQRTANRLTVPETVADQVKDSFAETQTANRKPQTKSETDNLNGNHKTAPEQGKAKAESETANRKPQTKSEAKTETANPSVSDTAAIIEALRAELEILNRQLETKDRIIEEQRKTIDDQSRTISQALLNAQTLNAADKPALLETTEDRDEIEAEPVEIQTGEADNIDGEEQPTGWIKRACLSVKRFFSGE